MNATRTGARFGLSRLIGLSAGLLYLGGAIAMARIPRPEILAGVMVGAAALAAGWTVARRHGPWRGGFGSLAHERELTRVIDREVARSLRHGAPLVVAALRLRERGALKAVRARLRQSDIIIQGRAGQLIVVMTETSLEHARPVFERMVRTVPVRAVALADAPALRPAIARDGSDARFRDPTARSASTDILLQALRLGLFRAEARVHAGQPAPIYTLDADGVIAANATTNQRALDDYTRRIA